MYDAVMRLLGWARGYTIGVFVLALCGCLCVSGPLRAEASSAVQPVVDAERDFAAFAARSGWIAAFRAFVAPDGLIFAPELSSAPESLAKAKGDGDTSLQWWPAYAGISRSGDFGFTTGPAVLGQAKPHVHYFTVWRRQPDQTWKWIFDGGTGAVDTDPVPRNATPSKLPLAARGIGADAAVAEVKAIEQRLSPPGETLERWLAKDARVNRAGLAPGVGEASFAERLAQPASAVTYDTLRVFSSTAGDLVFTLGDVRWTREGKEQRAHYARIWQLHEPGWRIVYDQVM